jgi:hypothetical protein
MSRGLYTRYSNSREIHAKCSNVERGGNEMAKKKKGKKKKK